MVSELKMIYKGSEAAERKGVYYVISDMDHPATKLLQSPFKIRDQSYKQFCVSN